MGGGRGVGEGIGAIRWEKIKKKKPSMKKGEVDKRTKREYQG